MSIRIDIEWPDGAVEVRPLSGSGPWTIGGAGADVNLPGEVAVLGRVERAGDALAVAVPPSAPPRPWPADTPIDLGTARLFGTIVGDDDDDAATVALVRPPLDALTSVAVDRPDAHGADALASVAVERPAPDVPSARATAANADAPPRARAASDPAAAQPVTDQPVTAPPATSTPAATPARTLPLAVVGLAGLVVAMLVLIGWVLTGGS